MKWLDGMSLGPAIFIALLLGLAPVVPEPHLWEKLKMLLTGELARPLDIFDLFLHGGPTVLLALKLYRRRHQD
ncbi:MAG: RND transporter [Gemmatimonadetes bacterium]|nr:RND transporter [Gemmatimonadota bacterium]MBT6144123.1 RND transporter [Gemmatimonadota bacterium]MBT7859870.1 RND transporter [Gemmatimonadota bacterium]